MAYKYGIREQITFLPDSVEKYVFDDDPVRAYDAFIDAINLQELGLEINESYDPITMLKVLVYGYSYGWRSSRKLERALHHNLSFIWLSGGLRPDHKPLSNFRKNNKQVLKNVLKQCVRMCIKLNLIEGNVLFVDGSKMRANAGNSQTISKASLQKLLNNLDIHIEVLMDECQKITNLKKILKGYEFSENEKGINKQSKSQDKNKGACKRNKG